MDLSHTNGKLYLTSDLYFPNQKDQFMTDKTKEVLTYHSGEIQKRNTDYEFIQNNLLKGMWWCRVILNLINLGINLLWVRKV